MRRLNSFSSDFDSAIDALLAFHEERDSDLPGKVAQIISAVRAEGDAALLEYTNQFDRRAVTDAADLVLDRSELSAALEGLELEEREALAVAAQRIQAFHEAQKGASWSFKDELGNELGQRITPVARAGIYVPGGKASYPSSVLMNAIPAKVAGVETIVMCVPAPEGRLSPWVLAAAALAGVDRVVTIGGAQAIAAMAFGTATVPRVDKIVGPGNRFVAEAKRQVFGRVGIDMVAGPSEILIIADGSVPADWIAMDLFSQAEHDEQAQAILISPDAQYLDAVAEAVTRLLPDQPRADIIRASLAARGALIEVPDLPSAFALSNRIVPEHLELALADADRWIDSVSAAGAIFVGGYSSEALGDYCAGPNHVLPTSGTARFSSPLGVYDFEKRSSVIRCSREGAQMLGQTAAILARGESLTAHAMSAECRLDNIE
jgi:histidinol dehydrogenase